MGSRLTLLQRRILTELNSRPQGSCPQSARATALNKQGGEQLILPETGHG